MQGNTRTAPGTTSLGAAAYRRELLRLLDEAFAGPAWHGPSLRGALRSVTAAEARRSPGPGRNSIWDLTLHAAYGKYRVLRRLDAALAPAFPRPLIKDWWPRVIVDVDEEEETAWRRDRLLLDDYHRQLVEGVAHVPDRRLRYTPPGARFTLGEQVSGVALHDIYHAGQVRLLRRLLQD